jgi:DNA (cytosine-5)-methyltransferase 1
MKMLDLFSGIGGFSLAAHWLNWQTVAFVEKDKFCQKVLAKNFSGVPIYDDITEFDGTAYAGAIDIICGGFPCQDISSANINATGLQGKRSSLWFEMLRLIKKIRPAWVVIENVARLVKLGLDTCLSALETEGYSCQAFIIPACAVDAPHRRNRVWIMANSDRDGKGDLWKRKVLNHEKWNGEALKHQRHNVQYGTTGNFEIFTTDALSGGFEKQRESIAQWSGDSRTQFSSWREIEPLLCGGNDGLPNRVDRLRSLGNSIVPQIAYEIFKAIESTNLK